ncbi:hypothetical protein [Allokutzneria oryzae]|uniref:DUF2613 family protein n=1 Tax=Allokutzneria oryzae TaxID=1378989 RepID=A0ABV6A8P2_9PSEU
MSESTSRRRSVVGTIVGVCAAVAVPVATTLGALGAALFVAAKHSGPEPAPGFGPNPVAEETIEGSGTTDRAAGAELPR